MLLDRSVQNITLLVMFTSWLEVRLLQRCCLLSMFQCFAELHGSSIHSIGSPVAAKVTLICLSTDACAKLHSTLWTGCSLGKAVQLQ